MPEHRGTQPFCVEIFSILPKKITAQEGGLKIEAQDWERRWGS